CDPPRLPTSTLRCLPGSAERWRSSHLAPERPPSPAALPLSGFLSFKPPLAAVPTPRTAGDALPLLQLKFVATCRLPGFCRRPDPRKISAVELFFNAGKYQNKTS
uniref:Uncharacterized protein n=1 Tax=Rhinolophus ferrumequinum TaxID=59479 RepID=A0A671EZV3_RHIFE